MLLGPTPLYGLRNAFRSPRPPCRGGAWPQGLSAECFFRGSAVWASNLGLHGGPRGLWPRMTHRGISLSTEGMAPRGRGWLPVPCSRCCCCCAQLRRRRKGGSALKGPRLRIYTTRSSLGQTSWRSIVQAYVSRAKAYNGTCTALVTTGGEPIPQAIGTVRAGASLTFPTQTVPVSGIFPNFGDYAGLPFEFGRMESTISDPSVQQQFGMRVGIPNAGQLNALETLNIRGERSVTCKGDFDRAPSAGPLPPGAPAVCEEFRRQPDAVERAAELDRQYGSRPDLEKLPMYCAVFSIKNWYDAKDMRATGGNDVNFAMDAPKIDSPDVATLRRRGRSSTRWLPPIPSAAFPGHPQASRGKPRPWGMRIGIVREFMVKHTKNDVAISDELDKEIKIVLRDKLGAELVESVDPLYPDDPATPNMTYTFQDAMAEILPVHAPEYFWQRTPDDQLEFAVPVGM